MVSSRQQPQHVYTLNNDERFILYGDSIIQQSFSPYTTFAFGAALAHVYARKLDVVNRGLWGYNTLQALRALSLSLPHPEVAQMKFLLIMFGAIDAMTPNPSGGVHQSVGVEEFQRNLRHMVCDPSVTAHGEDLHINLVTTPPVDERKCLKFDEEECPDLGRVLRRTAASTALYAQAVRDLGQETGVPVLEIHRAMLALAGHDHLSVPLPGSMEANTNATLQSFLVDGREWLEAMPNNLPLRLPAWDFYSARKIEVDDKDYEEILEWGEGAKGAVVVKVRLLGVGVRRALGR
ncbi:isoamyl acetate-hydrolyzing esterase [Elasticomyces elasticus]|nr:isoamyl acetate-hydrolyzing esterase [Elasticomyces elasticus]